MRRSALRSLIFIKSAKLESSISPRPVKFAEIVKIFQMRFRPCEIDFAMREKKGRNARVVFLFARVGDWARLGGVDSRLLHDELIVSAAVRRPYVGIEGAPLRLLRRLRD